MTYANGGTYQARLLVTDPGGLSRTSTRGADHGHERQRPDEHRATRRSPARPRSAGRSRSTTGTWTGTAPITYARQWQRCTTATGTAYSAAVLADAPSVVLAAG